MSSGTATFPVGLRPQRSRRPGPVAIAVAWVLAGLLPLIGLVSLLLREMLDPGWENPRVHFVLFLTVGGVAFALAYVAGEAAQRRGDARVLLMSLAFLATGGFMALHAIGTAGVLFVEAHAGFKVAIPVGLLLASVFAAASAFADAGPRLPPLVVHRRAVLQRFVLGLMVVWFVLTILDVPPLDKPASEGARHSALALMAGVGTLVYGAAAARYWLAFRGRMSLLPGAVIACFVLMAEAMIGVAVTGERAWHASWWEWHFLIVLAYGVVGFAARREWRDERFRPLYLETTRERTRDISVLFSDLAGFTSFTERSPASEVTAMLSTYYEIATPIICRRYGGAVEKLLGDGLMASFNGRGDQPDHALRAASAALELQRELGRAADEHPGWPRLRVGVNSGEAVIRELGGDGFVAYEIIGDTVNTGSRLEGQAPVGGVLIGAGTYDRLPDGTAVEPVPGLRVKGREAAVDAFVLRAVAG